MSTPTIISQSLIPSLESLPVISSDHLPSSVPFVSDIPSDTLPSLVSSLPISSSVPVLDLPSSHSLSTNHLPMQTRSKSGISKPNPKLCYKAVLDYTFTKLPSYKVAAKYPEWCKAMDDEFQALQR